MRRACCGKAVLFISKKSVKSLPLGEIPPRAGEMSAKQTKGGRLRQEKVDWPKAKTDEVETLRALPVNSEALKSLPCARGGAPQGRRG